MTPHKANISAVSSNKPDRNIIKTKLRLILKDSSTIFFIFFNSSKRIYYTFLWSNPTHFYKKRPLFRKEIYMSIERRAHASNMVYGCCHQFLCRYWRNSFIKRNICHVCECEWVFGAMRIYQPTTFMNENCAFFYYYWSRMPTTIASANSNLLTVWVFTAFFRLLFFPLFSTLVHWMGYICTPLKMRCNMWVCGVCDIDYGWMSSIRNV